MKAENIREVKIKYKQNKRKLQGTESYYLSMKSFHQYTGFNLSLYKIAGLQEGDGKSMKSGQ